MLFIEASVIVAILPREHDGVELYDRIMAHGGPYRVSPIMRMEVSLVIAREMAAKREPNMPPTPEMMEQARKAVDLFIEGSVRRRRRSRRRSATRRWKPQPASAGSWDTPQSSTWATDMPTPAYKDTAPGSPTKALIFPTSISVGREVLPPHPPRTGHGGQGGRTRATG
ncbi:hypothetical protein [Aureimonas pseudogalii]|uniref:Uncharacterized protein with PIN domain n=1 Tax=Aureimonas pseudogalii TaxID=1744844 RepID=A0A7W6H975_9HYPH|nr:hypothetical protein [Aureimonas pseudogalii]MBB4000921.1 uncharacterized protein with PIN domain [Aureimonas pseudogalii]